MSKLNIENHQVDTASTSWRPDLAKVDVWYASYGSNMWEKRFLCYIQGGKVEGMTKACVGSMDKSLPKEIVWGTFPHRLFFGRESTGPWGVGGSAFINPLTDLNEQTHMCLYRITLSVSVYVSLLKYFGDFFLLFLLSLFLLNRLEQFNDVMFQENDLKVDSDFPLFDLSDLRLVENKGSQAALDGWYGDVVCLGKEGDIPILTMTCTPSAVEKFKSGESPRRPPAKAYANTLIKGLVEGGRLSEEEAKAYIDNAASKPL